jgi:hypothetical protein
MIAAGVAQSVVSDYELDDKGSVPSGVQISSEAHPASYPMGKGSPFPGVKCGQGTTQTTVSRSCLPSPLAPAWQ